MIRSSQIFLTWMQYHQQQQTLIQKIIDRIRNSLELKVVLQTAVDEIATLLHLDRCCFLWYFEDTQRVQVVCEYLQNPQQPSQLGYLPLENFGEVAPAIAAGELIINSSAVRSIGLIARLFSRLQWQKSRSISLLGARNNLLIPIKHQEEWTGFIACISEHPRHWKSGEIEFLQAIAQQLEIAISQARLYEQIQKQAQRERLVNQITNQTRQSFDIESILTEAINQLMEALEADRCLVHLVESASDVAETSPETTTHLIHQSATTTTFRGHHLYEVCRQPFLPSLNDFDSQGPITQWVIQHRQRVVISDITCDRRIGDRNQEYLAAEIKSSLVVPVQANNRLHAIIYLNQCSQIRYWSKNDQKLTQAVADQLAISLQQAKLYAQTQLAAIQSAAQAQHLAETLQELQLTQAQLIQNEKLSSLGRMVAGVAHEINNPVNFIYGNIPYIERYTEDLIRLVQSYQIYYPQPVEPLQELVTEVELDFLLRDLPKILRSMKSGAERIHEVVQSLQNFSHLNEAPLKTVDLHAALESTLLILHNHFTEGIQVTRNFGDLPPVECYPQQINQVFLSLLMNAIEALGRSPKPERAITLQTDWLPDDAQIAGGLVRVAIADNGLGIPVEIQPRIFDPFFTTKDVGQGRGLGLSLSYQTIVNQHQGNLYFHSELEQGTEFIIEIPVRIIKN